MKVRRRTILFIVFLAGVGGGAVWCWNKIESNTRERANFSVSAEVDGESVAEVGYIWDLRRQIVFSELDRKVRWWIKIPSTDVIYSCSWEGGFPSFEKDEGVMLIHKKPGQHYDWTGYVVGLHGSHKGRAALVWAVDVAEIEDIVEQLRKE